MAYRGVAQLARLDVGYSLHAGASKGVREFVNSPLMEKFQKAHPHVQLQATVNNKGLPHVAATYCQSQRTGAEHMLDVARSWLLFLRGAPLPAGSSFSLWAVWWLAACSE